MLGVLIVLFIGFLLYQGRRLEKEYWHSEINRLIVARKQDELERAREKAEQAALCGRKRQAHSPEALQSFQLLLERHNAKREMLLQTFEHNGIQNLERADSTTETENFEHKENAPLGNFSPFLKKISFFLRLKSFFLYFFHN